MNAEGRKKIRERVARCHMMGQELGPDLTVGEWTSLLDDVDRVEAENAALKEQYDGLKRDHDSMDADYSRVVGLCEKSDDENYELRKENAALKARVAVLEEVRKAATLNVEKMERITDIDWTETDEYWALRAALDGVKTK